jgi:flagellar FliL protein
MADEETVVEGAEQGTEETADRKGKSSLLLFGGIGLGAVAIGIALAMFVIGPMMNSDSADAGSDGHATEQAADSHGAAKKSSGHGGDSKGGQAPSLMYTIEDIVVNPAGTGGSRFLSTSIGFELGSGHLASEFSERDPIVRDALITILASKTVAQLTDAKQKEITRYQIKKRVSKLMNTDELVGVYYTNFVLQ